MQGNWRRSRRREKPKGLYDQVGRRVPVIVTGSARLDLYKKGGESLLGRYIPYRLHPFSVAVHLQKACHFRTDLAYGVFDLCYLRTKELSGNKLDNSAFRFRLDLVDLIEQSRRRSCAT